MRRKGVGVVIGRFQVPRLHGGHMNLIEEASECDKLLICIGVSKRLGSPTDPLDYPSREQMIKERFPKAIVVPLPDHPGDDDMWSKNLNNLIGVMFPTDLVTLFHGRDSFLRSYKGPHKTYEVEEVEHTSGTMMRDAVGRSVEASEAFRCGVIYGATNQWARATPVVDICVWRDGPNKTIEILVGKRNNERGVRFPGGHIDITDESGEEAARRELFEETGLRVLTLAPVAQPRCKTHDAPGYAMFTTLYLAKYVDGAPVGASDLDEVLWVGINVVDGFIWADGHRLLADMAIRALQEM